ncbi:DNA mismatch repair protein Mlh3 protein [Dioscorea alata]|uniref:DNA mismatch repair protein Mlh3 protein n=2 Tax=Dioscorea alata TaxID=55571 RepID=A0ACB7WN18_DIOAL|nr:DNA mismatch repair protein Mlh3 protein [Dioscorea alata]KAH7689881.1 DNA mismatch repair protein Mlh3 protein [Dioscorea alata]
MKDIKRLSPNVCNSLRSSVVLFDLARVVEELIFNSVEACATKVFIHLNVRGFYIKVEDDGYGITRDGLVLLGENLATSRIHLLSDMEAYGGSLVCRGEALGSLSDVSLVEVLSKARGKPNSYRKIIKGRKCLSLGISDQRDAVGTTVIVRDLFYNQPVRRKYIQYSLKKVLHSVKKCVLRTALVNPEILFKVVDLESEAELLRTLPSSSPLHLISIFFGDEVSGSLQEITFTDKDIQFSGYISGPRDAFSTKAFQYVYINSRFVCKGPIHNLLNSLASSLQSSTEIKFHSRKRPRTQTYPAYILNICCPISMYDLTFEPSKTILEFKDWTVVLTVLKQAIWQHWEKLLAQQSQGKACCSNDAVPIDSEIQNKVASKSCTIRKRKDVVQSPQSSSHPTAKSLVNFEKDRLAGTVKRSLPELKPCRSSSDDVWQTNCSSQGQITDKEVSFSFNQDHMGCAKICSGMSTSNSDSAFMKDSIFSFDTLKANSDTNCLGLRWGDNSCRGDRSLEDVSAQMLYNHDPCFVKNNTEDAFILVGSVGFNKSDLKANRVIESEHLNSASYSTCSPVEFESGHSKHLPVHDLRHSPGVGYDSKTSKLELMWHQQVGDSVIEKCQATRELDILLGDSVNPLSPVYSSFTKKSSFHSGLTTQLWGNGSNYVSRETGRYIGSPYYASGRTLFDDFAYTYNFDAKSMSFENVFGKSDGVERSFKHMSDNSQRTVYTASFKGSKFNYLDCFSPDKTLCHGQPSDGIRFEVKVNDDPDRWFLDHSDAIYPDNLIRRASNGHMDVAVSILKHKQDKLETQDSRLSHGCLKIRSGRSQSAPPFYKGKCKFSIVNTCHHTTGEGKENVGVKCKPGTISSFKELAQPSNASQPLLEASLVEISSCSRESSGKVSVTEATDEALDNKQPQKADYNNAINNVSEDELEYASGSLTKWRNHDSQPTGGEMHHDNNDDILDISSGLLHLTGSSLVPDSISRECLKNARVLLQVDKKFIPVIASDTLIVIDQHAADERIRLEELRQKVLSGEGNNISYLGEEQDLILPEIGFQILHNYADQIQKWGWICNIHTECSDSFVKNMNFMNKRPHAVTLVAVPCILGIDLTDKDLLEYLEQLAETDGSSTLPPAVIRILNFKACRGAIMFGDSLLPSECSLIVEELKETSLCFQCAHGRPTTAPLLNMVSLHEQLTLLEMRLRAPENAWHGLSQHRPSIERAQQRLASARRSQQG